MRHLLNLLMFSVAAGLGWSGAEMLGLSPSPSWFVAAWTAGMMYLLVGWRGEAR